jgi:putative peptidoglycan lipid II flippase
MTLISRVLGFVRDMILARVFGAGMETDAFFVAFKIPNFLRRLFAEGAFSQAFVPVLSEYKEKRDKESVRELVQRTAGTLGGVLFVVTLIGVLASPLLIYLFAPGFSGNEAQHELAAELLQLTFPYILFISLTALAGAVLNTYEHFAAPAFAPVFLNICLIGAALWLAPMMDEPVMALAWGVFASGIVQLLFQLPFLAKRGLLARPRWGWKDSGVRRILKLMGPAILGVSVVQINLLMDTIIASFLVAGSVSWLYFSDRLVEFPLGVFGIALATVVLPSLSKLHANEDKQAFSESMDWALRCVLMLGMPAMLGLFLLAGPILATLFFYDAFDRQDLEMATLSLMAYSLGLVGFIMVKVLAPGFYARQDTKTPVKVAIKAMVANMVMNILFVVPMVWFDIPGAHAGLALATALSAFINAGLLYYLLRQQQVYAPGGGWWVYFGRVVAASVVMTGLILWGSPAIEQWMAWSGMERFLNLMMWVLAGAGVYFLTLFIMGVKPRDLMGRQKTAQK